MAYQEFAVAEVISKVDSRKFGIPDFQRPFLWTVDDRLELLRTVVRGWSSGAILLLKADKNNSLKKLKVQEVETAPVIGTKYKSEVEYLILDGQQRITTLYQIFSNKDDRYRFFVDLNMLEPAAIEFNEESIKWVEKDAYPPVKIAAEQKFWVAFDELVNEVAWDAWLNHLDDDSRRSTAEDLRDRYLRDLDLYKLPALMLDDDEPLGSLVRIFSRLNKQGEPLSTFDMTVALMRPQEGFDLRKKEEEARATCSEFVNGYGGAKIGLNLLRTITLIDMNRSVERGEEYPFLAYDDAGVIDLADKQPEVIVDTWETALEAYAAALELLATQCGSVRKRLLPSDAAVATLATALTMPKPRNGWKQDLVRWVWVCWFQQFFAATANTKARRESVALWKWGQDADDKPEAIRNLEHAPEAVGATLEAPGNANGTFLKGLMALLVSLDAYDWYRGEGEPELLKEWTKPIDFHHIYAKDYVGDDPEKAEKVLNFTPIKSKTNQSLREDPPSKVLENPRVNPAALESHWIDRELFAKDLKGFKGVMENRRKRALAAIQLATGVEGIVD